MKNLILLSATLLFVSIITAQPIIADFTVSNDTICPFDTLVFDATISGGDGGPYTITLPYPGVITLPYTIFPFGSTSYSFQITDSTGNQYNEVISITVLDLPPNSFAPDTIQGCNPLTVTFTESSPNLGQSYFWQFGDGGTDTTKNPTHIYQSPGIYDVTSTITSSDGCINEDVVENLIIVNNCGAVDENDQKQLLSIFPNPTTGLVVINNEKLKIKNVSVYDIYGKEVLQQEVVSPKHEVDLSNHPQGIYIIRVTTDKQTITQKVIKQ